MGTDNPKVSAYVPQSVKDRLKQFREERNISESQAVIIILAEYFQMSEVLGRSPERAVGGVTLARMEALEKKLADFSELVEHRLQEFREAIDRLGELPMNHEVVQQEHLEQEHLVDEQDSSPLSELSNGLHKDDIGVQEKSDTIEDKLPANDESQENQNSESTDNLLSEPPIDNTNHTQIPLILGVEDPAKQQIRIDIDLLARRTRMTTGSLRNKRSRSKLDDQKFTEWTTKKDIDEIGWRTVKEGKRVYYEPAMPLKDELLDKLSKWIQENRN
jgi:hypothetical protein